ELARDRLEADPLRDLAGFRPQPAVAGAQHDRPEVPAPLADDRQVEVVLDRQAEEEPRGLVGAGEPHADPAPGGQIGHVGAEELNGARGRRELAGDDVEERRLPGPVWPEDGAPLAGPDLQVDAADGLQAAEAPADPPQ